MKRFRKCLTLVFVLSCLIQLSAFNQVVFAASKKSSVGITFEGSVPQSSTDPSVPSSQDTDQSADQSRPKKYPKTNEIQQSFITLGGIFLLVISLLLIFWKRKRNRE
ncbi:LPXTG cell wall anchor domain-containing protein [Enterococcus faecium]|nr:LPXTG cell wall anchor domain-containing protein [Enterococcus faecium]EGP5148198.1 LPXTG cell wall anchor domain-containing protein [Enterococcus faecium]EGP5312238.1 LPXTG cell wall anchor domain-containing protein [Enterococcus faecium]EJF8928328.1 LPXTG cell wall anchor domain-containing protein [Enterococcus faecium]EMC2433397.1 LPXTG cell wall anchor domain-containing protein [Enterococcus faecium]